jgi:hypothetical protein
MLSITFIVKAKSIETLKVSAAPLSIGFAVTSKVSFHSSICSDKIIGFRYRMTNGIVYNSNNNSMFGSELHKVFSRSKVIWT